MKYFRLLIFCFIAILSYAESAEELLLKSNLSKAKDGDYLVTVQNKNYTLLVIHRKDENSLSINEITIPTSKIPSSNNFSWRAWAESGAPQNTCWVVYTIHLPTGRMEHIFSYTRNEWVSIPQSQNFLTTLLNLQLHKISDKDRKRIGPPPATCHVDKRPVWQPKLTVEGNWLQGIAFEGYKARWPKDGSDLSEKEIEMYLPQDSDKYPSYFPYWLQVSGLVGKARVRIVDSGTQMMLKK